MQGRCPGSWLFSGKLGLSLANTGPESPQSIKRLLNHPQLRWVQRSFVGLVYLGYVNTCVCAHACMYVLNWRSWRAVPTLINREPH